MLAFPTINPVAFSIGPLQIHWYGMMYLLAFLGGWVLARWRVRHYHLDWSNEAIGDLIFYAAVGVIIGGRFGYMLFYQWGDFIADPLSLFKIWEGGMSFHGGLLGVIVALCFVAYKLDKKVLEVGDFIAPLVPFGIALGRLGNFINGELWGNVTDVPWAMIFPRADLNPRHPSQLYEFATEGVLLFILIWWYASKPRPRGCVAALFLMGYAVARFAMEFFRSPDPQWGYLAFGWLTMGQVLSLPVFIIGLIIWWKQHHATIPRTAQ